MRFFFCLPRPSQLLSTPFFIKFKKKFVTKSKTELFMKKVFINLKQSLISLIFLPFYLNWNKSDGKKSYFSLSAVPWQTKQHKNYGKLLWWRYQNKLTNNLKFLFFSFVMVSAIEISRHKFSYFSHCIGGKSVLSDVFFSKLISNINFYSSKKILFFFSSNSLNTEK